MSWVKIDDQFPEHPKLAALGLEGLGLQTAALCYCNRQLTDGFISAAALPRLTGLSAKASTAWARRMVDARLWEEMPGGFQVHDYLEYQPKREDVLASRQKVSRERSKAGSNGAAKRWQTDGKEDSKTMANGMANAWPRPDPDPNTRSRSPTPSRPGRAGARKVGGELAEEILRRSGLAPIAGEEAP